MNEQDFYKSIKEIQSEVKVIKDSVKPKPLKSLYNGILTGFGSVFGAFIALAIVGWVLNIVGVIPAFKEQVNKWQSLVEQTQQSKFPSSTNKNVNR